MKHQVPRVLIRKGKGRHAGAGHSHAYRVKDVERGDGAHSFGIVKIGGSRIEPRSLGAVTESAGPVTGRAVLGVGGGTSIDQRPLRRNSLYLAQLDHPGLQRSGFFGDPKSTR